MTFADSARRLFGNAAVLLGWRPDEFWSATPEELGCILLAMTPVDESALDGKSVHQLMEQFPDISG